MGTGRQIRSRKPLPAAYSPVSGRVTCAQAKLKDRRLDRLFGHVQTPADVLVSPSLRIVSPKVESGRERAVVTPIGRREKLVKLLFDNATEKHGGTVLLYDRLPLPSLDTPALMARRLRAMHGLVDRATIKSARSTLCGARNCLEGLLDD